MITIILSFINANNEENAKKRKNKKLWYISDYHASKIIFGIMIYFGLFTIRSYVNSKIKVYMDLKYIATKKLLSLFFLYFSKKRKKVKLINSTLFEE